MKAVIAAIESATGLDGSRMPWPVEILRFLLHLALANLAFGFLACLYFGVGYIYFLAGR